MLSETVISKVCVVLSNFHKSGTAVSKTRISWSPLHRSIRFGWVYAFWRAWSELEDKVRSRISPQYFSERPSKSQPCRWLPQPMPPPELLLLQQCCTFGSVLRQKNCNKEKIMLLTLKSFHMWFKTITNDSKLSQLMLSYLVNINTKLVEVPDVTGEISF